MKKLLLLSCLFLTLPSLAAQEKESTVFVETVDHILNFQSVTRTLGVVNQTGYSVFAQKVADWLLQATGNRINEISTNGAVHDIRVSFTTLKESSNGHIPAKYTPMVIVPGEVDCFYTQVILRALIPYLPIRNYQERGKCRVSTGTRINSNFFARFEILKRIDSSAEELMTAKLPRKPLMRGFAAYKQENGSWFKHHNLPSLYGSNDGRKEFHPWEILRYEKTPCHVKLDLSTKTWKNCVDGGVITIEELGTNPLSPTLETAGNNTELF